MNLHLSKHARQRAAEMSVPTKEVKKAIHDPQAIDYPSGKHHSRVLISGRLALPYDPVDGTVITVLWRGEFTRGLDRPDVRVGPEG